MGRVLLAALPAPELDAYLARTKLGQVVAALNVSVNAARVSMDRLLDEFVPLLLDTAGTISADLGHRR